MKTSRHLTILLLTVVCIQTGCASAPHRQISQPLAQTRFKPSKTYAIKLHNRETELKVKGSQLATQNDQLIVRSQDNKAITAYPAHSIERINSTSDERVGSYALPGMGIGAAAIGLPLGLGFALSGCENSSDPGDCDTMRAAGSLIGGFGGALFGGAVGALIGWAIPKKAKVTITPTVSQQGNNTSAGVGFSAPF